MITLTAEQIALARAFNYYFVNTGGNNVVELIQRRDVSVLTNLPVAMLQVACYSQLQMLEKLRDTGWIFAGDA